MPSFMDRLYSRRKHDSIVLTPQAPRIQRIPLPDVGGDMLMTSRPAMENVPPPPKHRHHHRPCHRRHLPPTALCRAFIGTSTPFSHCHVTVTIAVHVLLLLCRYRVSCSAPRYYILHLQPTTHMLGIIQVLKTFGSQLFQTDGLFSWSIFPQTQ